MSAHMLSLAALHAVAPGVLDVVFGPDGDFPGAPIWRGPLISCGEIVTLDYLDPLGLFVRSPEWVRLYRGRHDVALDCRVPSVAARLLRLASFVETVDPNLEPHEIVALTLTLAPRIAALGGTGG